MRSTILLVQDDRNLIAQVSEVLCVTETNVIQCSTVREAVSALERSPEIELVLTDVQVQGGLDGYELAQIIRVFRPGLPIIVTSANPDTGSEKLPSSSTLLRKPWSSDDLLKLITCRLGKASDQGGVA